jgi:CxxC motif-containing protein (DUF1111 family)
MKPAVSVTSIMSKRAKPTSKRVVLPALLAAALGAFCCFNPAASSLEPFMAKDPGVRAGTGTGEPLANLTSSELQLFRAGEVEFAEAESVADGLGPRMNLDNCAGCHSQPAFGGTSPRVNPQIGFAKLSPGSSIPPFISVNGPVRVTRFVNKPDGTPDGDVHALFTIAGRFDAPECVLQQPNFAEALANRNVIFRIPTPLFGAGLIEMIPDSAILSNQTANGARNKALGIIGRAHFGDAKRIDAKIDDSDRGIARFGWKAQNRTLLGAAAEAYQVEMGITNEVLQTERIAPPACSYANATKHATLAGQYVSEEAEFDIDTMRRYRNPLGHRYMLEVEELRERLAAFTARNRAGQTEGSQSRHSRLTADDISSLEKFVFFMRFLAPPKPSVDTPGGSTSIVRGKELFNTVGCAACHTPTFVTGKSTVAALSRRSVNLYSDLLLHDMGPGLADGIIQGAAGSREFRTAPLWGLGQRLFFLHDGRTGDLLDALRAHASKSSAAGDASEADTVIGNFNALSESRKQDILNFLRSL